MLGIKPKDFDIEAYRLPPEQLRSALTRLGRTELVGRKFGVLKLWIDGLEIDIALPRSESKSGSGHQGFDIAIDPALSPEAASRRRDFTINAMMLDPLDRSVMDFHGGIKDLQNSTLRHVSDAFSEDPLRPLRGMQFAARFRLTLDPETARLCRSMLADAAQLSTERIWMEWRKWSHAGYPSYGLKLLQESGWIELYPELQAMIDCPQSPRWHPEGDVWTHTLQVCDQAARLARRNGLDTAATEALLFAALCHDFGKPACTQTARDGAVLSPGHSEAGIAPTECFLQCIGAPARLADYVRPLVLDHITHLHGAPTARAVRRLAHRLQPANIELWEMLVEADASGRAPAPPSRPAMAWLQQAREQGHHRAAPAAIVSGKMLLKLGLSPGPELGNIIKQAYAAQLEGAFEDFASAITWLREHCAALKSDTDR